MIVFANGGYLNSEFDEAFNRFKDFIVPNMTLLYIPIASEPDEYENKFSEFIRHLGETEYTVIDPVNKAEDITSKDFREYSAIILDDGDPIKLMEKLRESGTYDVLLKQIKNNIPLFAIGAGAIALGKYIGDSDIEGFNLFDGWDIAVYSQGYKSEKYKIES